MKATCKKTHVRRGILILKNQIITYNIFPVGYMEGKNHTHIVELFEDEGVIVSYTDEQFNKYYV